MDGDRISPFGASGFQGITDEDITRIQSVHRHMSDRAVQLTNIVGDFLVVQQGVVSDQNLTSIDHGPHPSAGDGHMLRDAGIVRFQSPLFHFLQDRFSDRMAGLNFSSRCVFQKLRLPQYRFG